MYKHTYLKIFLQETVDGSTTCSMNFQLFLNKTKLTKLQCKQHLKEDGFFFSTALMTTKL